jgi:NAD(P)-dependent dehydrogenase (short-subunit alcohol dehydrogenase family)
MSHEYLDGLCGLAGRCALVTGGSRGLGLHFARALGKAGAKVVLVSRKSSELQNAFLSLSKKGIETDYVATDLSKSEEIESMVDEVIARHGAIDILVNNAGASWGALAEEHPIEAWHKVMNLNVTSAFVLAQIVARKTMIPKGRGRIINIASVGGLRGSMPSNQTAVAYHASKGALVNMTRALSAEWGRYGVTVNALAPWYFLSDMTNTTIGHRATELGSLVPLGRIGKDDDLDGPVVFLASEMSKYVTGQILAVDGGFTAV